MVCDLSLDGQPEKVDWMYPTSTSLNGLMRQALSSLTITIDYIHFHVDISMPWA